MSDTIDPQWSGESVAAGMDRAVTVLPKAPAGLKPPWWRRVYGCLQAHGIVRVEEDINVVARDTAGVEIAVPQELRQLIAKHNIAHVDATGRSLACFDANGKQVPTPGLLEDEPYPLDSCRTVLGQE